MVELFSSKLLLDLIKKLSQIRQERAKELQEICDVFGSTTELAKFYVEPNCQHGNPADEDDIAAPICVPCFQVINELINKDSIHNDGRNQLFVLADAGMGKTSLLIMMHYFYIFSFWPNKFSSKLFKIGKHTIRDIHGVADKSKTILLLDALDEDPEAWSDYEKRIVELLGETKGFKFVIITCRTQFFPMGKKDPFQRSGRISIRGYTCPVIYLSLFNEAQIKEYLFKRFSYSDHDIDKANFILEQMTYLKARPLLLSHIEDLIESNFDANDIYNVYSALILAWLNREERKHERLSQDKLRMACVLVAIEMSTNGNFAINPIAIDALRIENDSIYELEKMDIGGRSLMNRDSFGNFRFSHYSIQEFLLAESILSNIISINDLMRINFSGMVKCFLWSYADRIDINYSRDMHRPGISLEGKSLNSLDFSSSNLVCLRGKNLDATELDFSECKIVHGNLSHSRILRSKFFNSVLRFSNLESSALTEVSFDGADLTEANLNNSDLSGVSFNKTNLKNMTIIGSRINECDFLESNMLNLNLDGCMLSNSFFEGGKGLTLIQFKNVKSIENCVFPKEILNALKQYLKENKNPMWKIESCRSN